MSIRPSPSGANAPQGDRLKTVLSAGLGRPPRLDRLSLHCTPCKDPFPQPPNYTLPGMSDPTAPENVGRTNDELRNICSLCLEDLAGPPEANALLPDDLERIRSTKHQFHRWCLAKWVWTKDTDPLDPSKRINEGEVDGLRLLRPIGVDVWPIPVQVQQTPKQLAIAAVTNNGYALAYVSYAMRGDKDVVLAAVRKNGIALTYTSDRLRNDKEVVLAAVAQIGEALQYASDTLKNDREVVLAAVAQDGDALRHASDALKNDREAVLAVVAQDWRALQFASDEMQNDREVVQAAVAQNGWALQFASDALKKDREVVLTAVTLDANALQYASDDIKNDKEVVLVAVTQDGRALQYASDELKNDPEVVSAAEQQ